MFVISPPEITCWTFPDDAVPGKAAFLGYFSDPSETWVLAYSLTLSVLVDEIIAAHKGGTPLHMYVDHSQSVSHTQAAAVGRLAQAGVEVTIGTSYAGRGFIAHEKGYATANGDCWEGSTNFSQTAWQQINTAMQFNSSVYRDNLKETFAKAVEYAWTHERAYQVMQEPPAATGPLAKVLIDPV